MAKETVVKLVAKLVLVSTNDTIKVFAKYEDTSIDISNCIREIKNITGINVNNNGTIQGLCDAIFHLGGTE
jgi:hypothetical protein